MITKKETIDFCQEHEAKKCKDLDEVWVSLNSLKIIENRLTANDLVKKMGDNLTYAKIKEAIHNIFNEELGLCNSQEQNEIALDYTKASSSSVSCEHNTGEDSGIKDSHLDKESHSLEQFKSAGSSPVQNHQWFCGGKEPCACMESFKESQNPKKCTCEEMIFKNGKAVKKIDDVCQFCGGVKYEKIFICMGRRVL